MCFLFVVQSVIVECPLKCACVFFFVGLRFYWLPFVHKSAYVLACDMHALLTMLCCVTGLGSRPRPQLPGSPSSESEDSGDAHLLHLSGLGIWNVEDGLQVKGSVEDELHPAHHYRLPEWVIGSSEHALGLGHMQSGKQVFAAANVCGWKWSVRENSPATAETVPPVVAPAKLPTPSQATRIVGQQFSEEVGTWDVADPTAEEQSQSLQLQKRQALLDSLDADKRAK